MDDLIEEPIILLEQAIRSNDIYELRATVRDMLDRQITFEKMTLIGIFLGLNIESDRIGEVVREIFPLIDFTQLRSTMTYITNLYLNSFINKNKVRRQLALEIIDIILEVYKGDEEMMHIVNQLFPVKIVGPVNRDDGIMFFKFVDFGADLYRNHTHRGEPRYFLTPIFSFYKRVKLNTIRKLEANYNIDYTFEVEGKNYYNAILANLIRKNNTDRFEDFKEFVHSFYEKGVPFRSVFNGLLEEGTGVNENTREISVNKFMPQYINTFRILGANVNYDFLESIYVDRIIRYNFELEEPINPHDDMEEEDYITRSHIKLECFRILMRKNIIRYLSNESLYLLSLRTVVKFDVDISILPNVIQNDPGITMDQLIPTDEAVAQEYFRRTQEHL